MTGLDIARQAGCPVSIGTHNAYLWWRREIVLTPRVADGTNGFARVVAAHEVEHHRQNVRLPWLRWARLLEPVRWWTEIDAWRRAIVDLA